MTLRLEFNKSFVTLLSGLAAMSLYSCGLKKSNDINTQTQEVEVSSKLGVSAIIPTDVLYVLSGQKEGSIQEERSSQKGVSGQKEGKLSSSLSLALAKGDGGLEADLTQEDSLTPYSGIPIKIQKTDISEKGGQAVLISVSGSGDKPCANLIHYDALSSQIIFNDTNKITQLTVCTISVSVRAAVQSKVLQDEKSFQVAVNPTFAVYAQQKDPVFTFMTAKTSLKDLNFIAQWLKKPEQTSQLKIDPHLVTEKIENLNALTGAKNITALDLSGTDLKDIRALLYFSNLEKLDISDTRIDPKDLVILGQLKSLKSLSVRNLALKDLSFITNNIPNLVELDISENEKIQDLSEIKNLKNLLVLKASHIGFSDFEQLAQITQITSLDISHNDLSKLSQKDLQSLVNLYSLSSLNVSSSKISDEFLNQYFALVARRNSLTTFIDRNNYDRELVGGCENINVFDNIQNIMNLTNLTYVDLHGNGCNETSVTQKGLTQTAYFTRMPNLKYLDISDTAVMDLSGVTFTFLRNLHTLILVDSHGSGISMNKEQCEFYLGESVGRGADCNKLPGGTTQSKLYSPGTYTWTVPHNVHSVTITGCSGANSGAGGGGGGGGATIFSGNWHLSSWAGDGAASGNVNNQSNASGGSLGTVGMCEISSGQMELCVHDHQAPSGTSGGDGGLGEQTSFGIQSFTLANSFAGRDPNQFCVGGSNGSSGAGGEGTHSNWNMGGHGGTGGTNTTTPWSSSIEHYTLSVTPNEVIPIHVGASGTAGMGGSGGGAQGNGEHDAGASQSGLNGSPGVQGTNGFLKIEWSQ